MLIFNKPEKVFFYPLQIPLIQGLRPATLLKKRLWDRCLRNF